MVIMTPLGPVPGPNATMAELSQTYRDWKHLVRESAAIQIQKRFRGHRARQPVACSSLSNPGMQRARARTHARTHGRSTLSCSSRATFPFLRLPLRHTHTHAHLHTHFFFLFPLFFFPVRATLWLSYDAGKNTNTHTHERHDERRRGAGAQPRRAHASDPPGAALAGATHVSVRGRGGGGKKGRKSFIQRKRRDEMNSRSFVKFYVENSIRMG